MDMVMNGHTHSYERGEKEHVHYLVSGGGGGGLDDFFVDYDHITFSDGVHHFTRIDVNDDELTVTAVDEHGRQVDRFVINKYASLEVDPSVTPQAFSIEQNYPNPFADSTTIRYAVTEPQMVALEVFDMTGKHIATLVERNHGPGQYVVVYDAARLASGVYTYRLTAGTRTASRQFSVVR